MNQVGYLEHDNSISSWVGGRRGARRAFVAPTISEKTIRISESAGAV